MPSIARSRVPGAPPGIDASSPRVYGCCGSRKIARTGACFDDAPGVHDGDAVGRLGDDAEVVRDEQQRQVRALPSGRAAGRGSAPGS